MTIGGELIWDWLRKAPLPVVLAISLSLSAAIGTWVYAVDATATTAAKDAAVAVEGKREQARRLEKIDEKLDKLLEAVVELRAEQKKAAEPAPAAKPKKAGGNQ